MDIESLYAISPIDGRYRDKSAGLKEYFSEFGLFRYRVRVEIEYLISLSSLGLKEIPGMDGNLIQKLKNIYLSFSTVDAVHIKEIEEVTNHDVKAVEYFIKEKLQGQHLDLYKEFVHFGLTSQDINNTAVPLFLKDAYHGTVKKLLEVLMSELGRIATQWRDIPMLARTHGQPASPTLLGKEIRVFQERLKKQVVLLEELPFTAKFGGATGGLNAHYAAYPDFNWDHFADEFIQSLGLRRNKPTTQIDHYDDLAAFFDAFKRINNILIDLCRDIWHYISLEYFKQKISEKEVGSSTMPHKVNPIDFENAEGNLSYANAIFEFFSAKLPVSRLQRDLTDSTVLRNVGVPITHSYIAYQNIMKGLGKLELNVSALEADLNNNWAVISEGIQTILRREGFPEPYEALKKLTRNNRKISQVTIIEFIDGLNLPEKIKEELKKLTPFNYTGRDPY